MNEQNINENQAKYLKTIKIENFLNKKEKNINDHQSNFLKKVNLENLFEKK